MEGKDLPQALIHPQGQVARLVGSSQQHRSRVPGQCWCSLRHTAWLPRTLEWGWVGTGKPPWSHSRL